VRPAILAAITLQSRGGGVASVSRLLWRVFRDQFPDSCRLITLLDDGPADASLDSTKAMRLRFGARLAKEQLLGDDPFVLYSHLSLAQVQAYLPTALRRPYGIFLHGIEAWRPMLPMRRTAVENAALLIANSDYTAARIAEAHPWIGPIAACPLALCAPEPDGASSEAVSAIHGPHVVLVVARMSSNERYKGHDQLLDAWPAVRAHIGDAQLVFAGSGDDVPRLRAKTVSLGIAPSVTFTGFVADADLNALYGRAAVFAMPSRDEGFGLVYLEAMSHALPCIGSTHDAARETIVDGVTGILVPQHDVSRLAAAIVRLLADEQTRREMGRRGHDRLQQRFTYPMFRDRLIALLTTRVNVESPALQG